MQGKEREYCSTAASWKAFEALISTPQKSWEIQLILEMSLESAW